LPRKKLIAVYSNTAAFFSIGYFFATYITEYLYARYLMVFAALVLFSLAFASKRGINDRLLTHLFLIFCHFVCFSLCVFSGGGNSSVLGWFALMPALSLLLASNKTAYLNLSISIVLSFILFLSDTSQFIPYFQYKSPNPSFFNLQLALGLTGIIFIVVRIFSKRNIQLQSTLTNNINILSATEEELKQNIDTLAATQESLSNTLLEQNEINNQLVKNRNLLAERKEKQTSYNNKLGSLTKGNLLYKGDLNTVLYKLMEESAQSLQTDRASIWYFSPDKNAIVCKVQYDTDSKKTGTGIELKKSDFPIYLKTILDGNIIIAPDARTNPYTIEFNNNYFIPNNIYSLLDIPIFVDGNNIGVICFEHKKHTRGWEEEDISFAHSIVDLTAIAIYSSQKRNSLVEIGKQYLENETQREKLELLSQQLKMANANLEEKVKERTKELEEKNTYLAEYTFINVHLLRGPLCRIIGLTNLLNLDEHREENKQLLKLLEESNNELETLIKKITEVLEAGEALDRNSLQQNS